MKYSKIVKFCFWFLIFIFFCSYFVENSGYYEYHLTNQKNLTEEQIRQFESDVREGKDIDLNSYLKNNTVDYSNQLTKIACDSSLKLNDFLKKVINDSFRVLEKLVK